MWFPFGREDFKVLLGRILSGRERVERGHGAKSAFGVPPQAPRLPAPSLGLNPRPLGGIAAQRGGSGHPLPPGSARTSVFGAWGPVNVEVGGQSRKQVCLLLSKAGFRGRETGSELARILPFISSSSPRISRQELPKSRVLISRGLGCRLPGFVYWSLTLLCSILPTGPGRGTCPAVAKST